MLQTPILQNEDEIKNGKVPLISIMTTSNDRKQLYSTSLTGQYSTTVVPRIKNKTQSNIPHWYIKYFHSDAHFQHSREASNSQPMPLARRQADGSHWWSIAQISTRVLKKKFYSLHFIVEWYAWQCSWKKIKQEYNSIHTDKAEEDEPSKHTCAALVAASNMRIRFLFFFKSRQLLDQENTAEQDDFKHLSWTVVKIILLIHTSESKRFTFCIIIIRLKGEPWRPEFCNENDAWVPQGTCKPGTVGNRKHFKNSRGRKFNQIWQTKVKTKLNITSSQFFNPPSLHPHMSVRYLFFCSNFYQLI